MALLYSLNMDGSRPEMLELLDEECRDLWRSKELLEGLCYTCGATELAIQHLTRPRHRGEDYSTVVAQMRNLKDMLDKHMRLVRLIFVNVQNGSDSLQKLKDTDDPEMICEVNRLRNILLDFCHDLRGLIKQGAAICRKFHLACWIVLEFMVNVYCKSLE